MTDAFGPLNSPNDSPRDGTIHPIGQQQLAIYQDLARNWRTYRSIADSRPAMRCRTCRQSLWFISDRQGHLFIYTPQMKEALIVAHIRQVHPRLEEGYATN